MRVLVSGWVLSCAASLLPGMANGTELVTRAEAALPEGRDVRHRGITRGPGVQLVSPTAGAEVKPPFELRVAFQPRAGAKIALDTVSVVYARQPPVDLLERVRPGLSEQGIVVSSARMPPGRHKLVVSVADSEGRTTVKTFELAVAE